jgi:predicted metal-dependent hydrolase
VDYKFGQFAPEHLAKMKEGIELFNQQKYWECHESFEDLWMEDKNDPARNVYWAIIQVAAACIHYRDSKIIGAQGMIKKAKEKFRRCREQSILTELAFKYLDWQELEELVMKISDQDAALSDFEELFNFRFKHFKSIPE